MLRRLFGKHERETTQEDYEHYMRGFRTGYPLVGQPLETNVDVNHPEYKRGLRDGRKVFKESGWPSIQYEASDEGK